VDLSPLFAHSDSRFSLPYHGATVQAQQAVRVRRHQLLGGGDFTWRRKTFRCHDFVTSSVYSGSLSADFEESAVEQTAGAYVRDDIEVTRWLHATAGARFVNLRYDDPLRSSPGVRVQRWNPYAGVSVRLRPATILHAAAFRNTNSDFLSANIWPPTVAGFVLERNELPTAQRSEGGVDVQNAWRRTFLEARAFVRSTVAPAFRVAPDDPNPLRAQYAAYLTPPDADFTARGLSIFFNQIVSRRVSLFADEQFVSRDSAIVDRRDNQARAGLNYIHPRGLFAKVSARWLRQRFLDTPVAGLPESSFVLADAEVTYEFAQKHGLVTWTVGNLFDTRFRTVIENLAVESPLPYRTMVLTLRWRI
jgi:hypothetical protein